MIAILFILLYAALFLGIVQRVRSILSGRKGPKILQPVYNIILLLRKGSVFSQTSSIIVQLAPTISVCATLTAALLVPLGKSFPSIFAFDSDFVLFACLLALGRFAYMLNAMDAGSSFQGMGASREALFGLLIEPAFFVLLGALALLTGNTSFSGIMGDFRSHGINGVAMGVLSAFVLFNIMLVETGRMPVDDSKTHLELTMIHEAMVLDNSGFDLALIQINALLKFSIFGTLICGCLIPEGILHVSYLLIYLTVMLLCAVVLGWFESYRVRFPLVKNASYMLAISAISLIAFFAAAALV
ncbi:MAG: NADH-quinone oxidoreductase subunit H [Prevotellaceae bacterium]|jgi:formate hydrogenlyase subunit 4|nr:NADH-quinone oxidoreductase subunit H [Prevotellaceae bacterium]